jgi:hypothetical protein
MQGRCLSLIAESAALWRAYQQVRATRYGHTGKVRYRLVAQPRTPPSLIRVSDASEVSPARPDSPFLMPLSLHKMEGSSKRETSLKYFCHCYVPPESDSFMARDQKYRRETRDSTNRAQVSSELKQSFKATPAAADGMCRRNERQIPAQSYN